jgi:DegV family protein with EDD domain
MSVKIITDSTSDISTELAGKLDIEVVPVYIRFGETVYRDGIDISTGEFYRKLTTSPDHPATSQPSPEDFINVYQEHIKDSDGIVTITISSKISGTYNSAELAKTMLDAPHPIKIIDSKFNSAGLGLVAIAAAEMARSGASFSEVIDEANRVIDQVRMFGMFQTMTYLARSGRVNKAIATASRLLNVMPQLTFRDGEILPAGFVRTLTKGVDRIYDFVMNQLPVSELTIVHSAILDQANQLKQRVSELIPEKSISIVELGAGLGVHGGPGVLLVALRRSDKE